MRTKLDLTLFWGNLVSNITSDIETRIGKWNHQEILDVLQIGMLPDGYFTWYHG